jgi:hypothetical protein
MRPLNQDVPENTFATFRLYCGSNDNLTVGQYADVLKTSIINGLAFGGLYGTKCQGDDTTLLDELCSLLRASDASQLNHSTRQGKP